MPQIPKPVQVTVVGGPSVAVPWSQHMNAQGAMETAYKLINSTSQFTYALQYYGGGLGYLVMMINETFDSFISSAAPFFYWEFLVNGVPSQRGIDNTLLQPGDIVSFSFEMYDPQKHSQSTLKAKYDFQTKSHKPILK